jgi:hypothetical protein
MDFKKADVTAPLEKIERYNSILSARNVQPKRPALTCSENGAPETHLAARAVSNSLTVVSSGRARAEEKKKAGHPSF